AWWRSGRRVRGLAAAAGGMVVLFAAILAFNHARFGAALKTYGLEQLLPEAPFHVVAARALGLFFDVGFGLFAVAPLWALLVLVVVLLVAALGATTAALTLLWLAVPGWTYNLADGSSWLLADLGRELRLNLARLFPSAIRLRAASWWWPLVTLVLATALWRWPWRPFRAAA